MALSKAVPRDGRAARFGGRTLSACKSFMASATQGVALGYRAMHLRCETNTVGRLWRATPGRCLATLPCTFGAKKCHVLRCEKLPCSHQGVALGYPAAPSVRKTAMHLRAKKPIPCLDGWRATQGVALGYPAMHLRCEKLPCTFGAKNQYGGPTAGQWRAGISHEGLVGSEPGRERRRRFFAPKVPGRVAQGNALGRRSSAARDYVPPLIGTLKACGMG